jgi:hypothetical protein
VQCRCHSWFRRGRSAMSSQQEMGDVSSKAAGNGRLQVSASTALYTSTSPLQAQPQREMGDVSSKAAENGRLQASASTALHTSKRSSRKP